MMTSFRTDGSRRERVSASLRARTPKSAALSEASAPPNFPIAVRAADAINTDFMKWHRWGWSVSSTGVFGHKKHKRHKRDRVFVPFVPFVANPNFVHWFNYNPPMEGNP